MGGIAYVRKHEYEAMKAEIERLRHELSVMTTVRDAQAMVIEERDAEIERLRTALSKFFTPDRTKTLAEKIEKLQRAYEQAEHK